MTDLRPTVADTPNKSYWMGEDIDGMPREKLIEIIGYLARQLDQQRDSMRSVIEIQRLVLGRRSA